MHDNQIENIASDTFEDLTSLEGLALGRYKICLFLLLFSFPSVRFVQGNNQIKFMDGGALKSLKKLKEVYLNKNVCIDEEFVGVSAIAKMHQVVARDCGLELADSMDSKSLN